MGGYSWGNSQPGGVDQGHDKVYLSWVGDCPIPHINAKWNTPDDWSIYPLNMPITQVMVNAVIKEASIV